LGSSSFLTTIENPEQTNLVGRGQPFITLGGVVMLSQPLPTMHSLSSFGSTSIPGGIRAAASRTVKQIVTGGSLNCTSHPISNSIQPSMSE
jgi:hypothetical protein